MPRQKPRDLSVIIVSFNTRELTLACLRSVFRETTDVRFEVIVVDNDSDDGSADAVAEAFPQVKLLRSPQNLGFGAACNLAARHAESEYLLLLNPDSEVRNGAIQRALARMRERPEIGVLGARTLYADGALNETSCFGLPSLWGAVCGALGLSVLLSRSPLFNPENLGGWRRDTEREVGAVTGCFFMIKSSLWQELGGFDERFFMYSEDLDLCARVWGAGYRCTLLPDATIVHHGGRSEARRADKMAKVYRARAQFLSKHASPRRAALGVRLIDLGVAARVLAHALLAWLLPASGEKLDLWHGVWRSRSVWHLTRAERADLAQGLDARPGRRAQVSAAAAFRAPRRIASRPRTGRLRLAVRWLRFALASLRAGQLDFVANAVRAEGSLLRIVGEELFARLTAVPPRVECNLCGWRGQRFHPNTGPGYHEVETVCPGCVTQDRHRSLLALLASQTDFFSPGTIAIEVAPMRGFEALCLAQPELSYTSFDYERHAMERGDITNMRYADESADYFLCFHVLEHIPDEARAVQEIRRVLKPGGCAVLQVPIDWDAETTREYGGPDPRDVGHVRRHGRDFAARLAAHDLEVSSVSVADVVPAEWRVRFGLSEEPIFFARRPAGSGACGRGAAGGPDAAGEAGAAIP
jgi:N-acetylglucosaminyl-diphospho-decaprenol L-rhamnosyltransferase